MCRCKQNSLVHNGFYKKCCSNYKCCCETRELDLEFLHVASFSNIWMWHSSVFQTLEVFAASQLTSPGIRGPRSSNIDWIFLETFIFCWRKHEILAEKPFQKDLLIGERRCFEGPLIWRRRRFVASIKLLMNPAIRLPWDLQYMCFRLHVFFYEVSHVTLDTRR